jgi:hypothetical protein
VGVFAWIIVNRGPVGISDSFDGPFIRFWGFGCYLLPLAVLEPYLRAKKSAGPRSRRIPFHYVNGHSSVPRV